jgi:hypothetical protein
MNAKITTLLVLGMILLTACTPAETLQPLTTPAFATPTFITGGTPFPTANPFTPGTTLPITPLPGTGNICTDPQVPALIDTLKTAVLNSDGLLLASLVSPASGMDVRYFRDGTVVNYRTEQAKFLFETTFEVDWGTAPGSGEMKRGAFHDVVVPDLVRLFNQPYTLHCNELKYGGVTYEPAFPYDKGFYSIHFPGTQPNSSLDWHTWVAGIEFVDGRPYIYALMQLFWEP